MEERLVKLEVTCELFKAELKSSKLDHKQELKDVRTAINVLTGEFDKIIQLIKSIKWWLIGAVSFLVLQEIGLLGFIKKVLF